MAKNTEYEFEETMVTLTDEDGIDKDFYVDEIYEVDGRLYAALIPGFVENITEYYVFRIKDLGGSLFCYSTETISHSLYCVLHNATSA